jgi:hypothetical protein
MQFIIVNEGRYSHQHGRGDRQDLSTMGQEL